jgi:hypothetical protein
MSTNETPPPEAYASWQRFTLLDLLLLFPGYAIGAAITRPLYLMRMGGPFGILGAITTTALGGSILAGPIILSAQFLLRCRRTPLSAGEWLWLSPLPITALILGLPAFELVWRGDRLLVILAIGLGMAMSATSLAAVGVFFMSIRGRKNVPCFWTDRFGVMTAFVLAIPVILGVLLLINDPNPYLRARE